MTMIAAIIVSGASLADTSVLSAPGLTFRAFRGKGTVSLCVHLIKSLMSLNCAQMADSSPVMQGCVVISLKQHWQI